MQKGEEQATYKSDLCPFNLRSKKSFNLRATEEPARQGEFRKAEDNRIFLSTSLTMPPTRFPNSPPHPLAWQGRGQPMCKGHWWLATCSSRVTLGCPHTKGSKAKPISCQRPTERLLKPSFCNKGKCFTAVTFAVQTPT